MEIAKEINELFGEEYELIDIKENKKYLIYHRKCNQQFTSTITLFQHHTIPCPYCRKESKFNKKYPDFTFISTDESGSIFIHKVCDRTIRSSQETLYSKNNDNLCNECYSLNVKKRWQEKQEHRVYTKYNGEYTLVSEYTGYQERITLNHRECSYTFGTTPNEFFNKGTLCPYCRDNRTKMRKDVVLTELNRKLGSEYSLLSDFEALNHEVTVKHIICGKETTKGVSLLLKSNTLCDFCGNRLKTKAELDEKLSGIEDGQYIALGEFKNVSTYMAFQHKVCGRIYPVYPSSFMSNQRGTRCPTCCIKTLGRKRKVDSLKVQTK